MWREIETVRDRILRGIGTDEALIPEHMPRCGTWRKPLRVDEVNQMAQTPEVRQRPGRP